MRSRGESRMIMRRGAFRNYGIGLMALVLTAFAEPAFAGIGLGIAPRYPTLVQVGHTGVPVSISIQNTSSAPQNTGNVTLSGIRHTPSCGDASASVCVGGNIDPNVFSVSASATRGQNAGATRPNQPFACFTRAGARADNVRHERAFTLARIDVTTAAS